MGGKKLQKTFTHFITQTKTIQDNHSMQIRYKSTPAGKPSHCNTAIADSRRLGMLLAIAALKFESFSGYLLSEDIIRYKSGSVTPQNVTSPRLEGSPKFDSST